MIIWNMWTFFIFCSDFNGKIWSKCVWVSSFSHMLECLVFWWINIGLSETLWGQALHLLSSTHFTSSAKGEAVQLLVIPAIPLTKYRLYLLVLEMEWGGGAGRQLTVAQVILKCMLWADWLNSLMGGCGHWEWGTLGSSWQLSYLESSLLESAPVILLWVYHCYYSTTLWLFCYFFITHSFFTSFTTFFLFLFLFYFI